MLWEKRMNTPNQSNPETELNTVLEIIGKIAKIISLMGTTSIAVYTII